MKNKITRKDFFMEIKKSPGRFISIFFIVAMGVAFFSGIRSTEPDMRLTGDSYFDQTKLMDIKCVSTMGLTEDDIVAISQVKGVEFVEGSYSSDFLEIRGDQEKVVHVMAMNERLNVPDVTEGRLPEKAGECLADDEEGYEIGDVIKLKAGGDDEISDTLSVTELTVVGTGSSPCYLSFNRGNSLIGNGSVAAFLVVTADTFDMDVFTEAYIQVEDALAKTTYTDAYQNLIDYVMDEIEKITSERSRIRREGIVDEANEKLDEAKTELADARADADKELADGKKKLDDAAKEISDGEKELADGKKELDQAAKEISDGKKELSDAKKQLDSGKKELDSAKKELSSGKKQLDDSKTQLDSAKKEIDDGEKQLNDAKKQVSDGKKELENGKKQLTESQKQIDSGKQEYESGKKQLEDGKAAYDAAYSAFLEQKEAAEKEMADGQIKIEVAEAMLNTAWKAYDQLNSKLEELKSNPVAEDDEKYEEWVLQVQLLEAGLPEAKKGLDLAQEKFDAEKNDADAMIADAKALLAAAEAEFEKQKQIIADNEAKLEEANQQLTDGQKQIDDGWKEISDNETKLNDAESQIADNESKLNDGKKQYEDGKSQYDAGVKEYNAGKKEYEKGVSEYNKGKKQYENGVAKLADGEAQYQNGLKEYEDGVAKLNDGKKEYEDGLKEYEDGKKEAEEKFADAEKEIADAEKEIEEIDMPKWYVYDRSTLPEHTGYGENADRMKALGKVFPLIFFLVAALISLTNMTRMVEEQRINIGTMKALGYSRNEIAGKYLGYALLATIGGSIVGVLFGEKVFPFIIIYSYGIMYHHIPEVIVPYNIYYGLMASGCAIGTITLATLASCYRELREAPAVLMRPPAPKSGKRTLMERIPFVWNLLNFSWKSTIRNLLRYKKRFFMTIFGIGGCMGLMVFGYGLKDSIYEITQLQYKDLQVFKGIIYLQEDYSDEEIESLYGFMDEYSEVPDYMDAYMKNITLVNGKKERSTTEMVMLDDSKVPEYVHFRDRVSKEAYELNDEGVILSEKTAKLLGAGVGDTIEIRDEENGNMEVVVSAITENYMGHYMYLTPAYYEKVHGEAVEKNTVLFMTETGISNDQVEKIGIQIMKQDAVLSIGYMHDIQQQLDNLLSTLNLVIIVLIISAGLLAFVVLYNLNEVNITERRRELATLKVLGFHDSEVSSYVYRENIVLTLIGVVGGCIFGKLLHEFTISTVEVDAAMFGRIITTKSYVYSMLFTILFSIIINVVMHFKLKKIDMVESLKSIE